MLSMNVYHVTKWATNNLSTGRPSLNHSCFWYKISTWTQLQLKAKGHLLKYRDVVI